MLRVRIDSREVEVMPGALAQMMLDGDVSRHHLAKASDGAAERPLEYALDPPHCEALTGELLKRLRAMYASELAVSDIDNIRVRIEALCQWHWREPDTRARLLWVGAWLNELAGRIDVAVTYYSNFLRLRCRESHLRLLAYNNRGVLRLRLGRREGVGDLARAAMVAEPGAKGPEYAAGLPAACFNLLNLINAAVQTESLSEVVDEELSEFFAQLPGAVAWRWLGGNVKRPSGSEVTLPAPHNGAAAGVGRPILRHPDCRSLNRLTSNLAAGAMGLTNGMAVESNGSVRPKGCRLSLWSGDTNGDTVPGGNDAADSGTVADDFNRYADAASLLLADEIPSTLVGDRGPGGRVEQLAEEELAVIENLVACGSHDLARSRLEVQRRVLVALNRRDRLASLIAQVDGLLARIARAKREQEQLELQRACGNLVSETEQFCKLTSLAQAERGAGSLTRRLQASRAEASDEVAGLLEELIRRVEQHVVQLRRSEVEARVGAPLQQLRERWPTDWAVPVPEAAYRALAECLVNDPQSQVEDWSVMKDQLDAHHAQYCLRKALAELPGDRVSWEEIETVLVDALSLAPELWLTAAPLFGLVGCHNGQNGTETGPAVRTALESVAGRRWRDLRSDSASAAQDQTRHLFQRANALLERTFRALREDVQRFVCLWQCLEKTLVPALATAGTEVIGEVEALARTCLDHWPAGQTDVPTRADPRNPVRLFMESCEKARRLTEAERLLGEPTPAPAQARDHIVRALRLGLDTIEQCKRAAACLYLIEYAQEDTAPTQRQVLARLDEWVEGLVIDTEPFRGQEQIERALVTIRADVLVTGPASDADRTETPGHPDV